MTDPPSDGAAIAFDDAAAYEQFMGRWSRAAGALFLDWLAPPAHASWLEVGCGTGAFTQLVRQRCRPAAIVAVDPAPAQIAYARSRPGADPNAFQLAAAEALPCRSGTHDIVVSALALNFMTDRRAALGEMRRVTRAGGMIAGYVWDFAGRRMPQAPIVEALIGIGMEPPMPPGGEACALAALRALFAGTGLADVETTALEIQVSYPDFAAFWIAQIPSFSPTTRLIARLPEVQRARLIEALRATLPVGADGSIRYPARAHAVKARVPRAAGPLA
jgi:SAM-dependent methyltransferase